MKYSTAQLRPAFTLVEAMAALPVAAVIVVGLASAVVLAGRAIPAGTAPGEAVVRGYQAADQFAGELHCALVVPVRAPTAVEFLVPDRDADGDSESIRYAWSGTPGDPLTRKYNSFAPETYLENVHEFQVDYVIRDVLDTTTTVVTPTVGVELAYFEDWGGFAGAASELALNATNWVSQYITISIPAGATKLTFTQAKLMLRNDLLGIADVLVGIYPARTDGSYLPEAAPVGPDATIYGTDMSLITTWVDAYFSGVTTNDLSRTKYCIVVKGSDAFIFPSVLQYQYWKSAPDNGIVQKWTSNSGATWDPTASSHNKQDIRFHLYGTFDLAPVEQETVTARHYLTSADVTVRIGSDPSLQVRTSARILNAPEITVP